jgi:hypothetical protein
MKTPILVSITLLSSGCSQKQVIIPKLENIYVELGEETKCDTSYKIYKDQNGTKIVAIKLSQGECITNKLKQCAKDKRQLVVANKGLNKQIDYVNQEVEYQ